MDKQIPFPRELKHLLLVLSICMILFLAISWFYLPQPLIWASGIQTNNTAHSDPKPNYSQPKFEGSVTFLVDMVEKDGTYHIRFNGKERELRPWWKFSDSERHYGYLDRGLYFGRNEDHYVLNTRILVRESEANGSSAVSLTLTPRSWPDIGELTIKPDATHVYKGVEGTSITIEDTADVLTVNTSKLIVVFKFGLETQIRTMSNGDKYEWPEGSIDVSIEEI